MNAPTPAAALAAPVLPIPLADLHPSPTNPRRSFPPGPLAEMAESIHRHGVLQPILVRPWPVGYQSINDTVRYEIVAGERRYRASLLAEVPTIMATVRDLSDSEVLEIQILENLQREEVHPLEEAEGYQVLMLRTNYSVDDLSEKLGKSKAYIYARLKLCAITGQARQAFLDGKLTASVALLIARIPVPGLQQAATKEVLQGRGGEAMTARQAAEYVQRKYMLKLADAPFPRADAKLLDDAPKCSDCPKRTGNAPDLFPDVKSADVCTDPECWGRKRAAHLARQKTAAEADGKRVITGKEAQRIAPYGWSDYNQSIGGGLAYLDSVAIGAPSDKHGKTPTWRKLLGKDCPAATDLIEDVNKGTLHEAAPAIALRAAAKAAGIETAKTQRGDPSGVDERERERVAKAQTALRRTLLEKIMSVSGDKPLDITELRLLAIGAWQRLDFETQKMGRRILGYDGKIEREQTDAVAGDVRHWDIGEIHGFLRLITHVGSVRVGSWHSKPTDLPAAMVEVCNRWGIDRGQVRQDMPRKVVSGAKYQHPNNGMSWSGRGKQPVWVQEWLAAGNTLEELEDAKC